MYGICEKVTRGSVGQIDISTSGSSVTQDKQERVERERIVTKV